MKLDKNIGRIAINYDDEFKDFTLTLQMGIDGVISSNFQNTFIEGEEYIHAINFSEKLDITYEKEIPMAIFITTSSDSIAYIIQENPFDHPEYYKDHDFVQAITVTFSKE